MSVSNCKLWIRHCFQCHIWNCKSPQLVCGVIFASNDSYICTHPPTAHCLPNLPLSSYIGSTRVKSLSLTPPLRLESSFLESFSPYRTGFCNVVVCPLKLLSLCTSFGVSWTFQGRTKRKLRKSLTSFSCLQAASLLHAFPVGTKEGPH